MTDYAHEARFIADRWCDWYADADRCAADILELVNEARAELEAKLAAIEVILHDPPVPSRMLIPVIRNVIHPDDIHDPICWSDQ